jgi:hypothetical protein
MQGDGFSNEFQHFTPGLRDRDAPGQVRDVGAVASLALLNYDQLLHSGAPRYA